ncbi:pyridoxamine 5'-phosphate oxidase family protein [Nakamurella aerolata]|uniref:pyridoxamine 5'-phosphate oxidase family protein n=1 Tax=Nakamurella aerolata TaxID=1656892 RepID=UPI001BB0E517|nr:pyridoxamine 5'-phosphate oxidase family protein [Nakamurella aerolata]
MATDPANPADSPSEPSAPDAAAVLAKARYVSLTTFRRTGEPVATPVWIARDDARAAANADRTDPADRADSADRTSSTGSAPDPDRRPTLVTISMADAGKVKRLARDPRVQLQECDLRGRVRPHSPVFAGTAVVQRSDDDVAAARRAMSRKYLLARVGAVVQGLLARVRPGKPRAAIRITLTG